MFYSTRTDYINSLYLQVCERIAPKIADQDLTYENDGFYSHFTPEEFWAVAEKLDPISAGCNCEFCEQI